MQLRLGGPAAGNRPPPDHLLPNGIAKEHGRKRNSFLREFGADRICWVVEIMASRSTASNSLVHQREPRRSGDFIHLRDHDSGRKPVREKDGEAWIHRFR
jgi:hypothetical protein